MPKKVCIVGNPSVGKTCLLKRLINDAFNPDEPSSTAEEKYEWGDLVIHDRPGEDGHAVVTQTFFKGADAVIVAYGADDGSSYEDVEKHIENAIGGVKDPEALVLAIVATKTDKASDNVDAGRELATTEEAVFGATSASTGEGVKEFFTELASKL